MHSELKVTVLTDKKSYLNKYLSVIQEKLKDYSPRIIFDKNDLAAGDVAFYLSCYELIGEHLFGLNKHNIVIHESDLPAGKGWSPASWQIIEGKNEIPLTLFEMAKKADAGDIYFKDKVILDGNELIDEWQEKIVLKKIEMCRRFLAEFYGTQPIPQFGEESFYKRRSPEDCELNLDKTLGEQFNLLRIADNERYPAFFVKDGQKYTLKIEKAGSR